MRCVVFGLVRLYRGKIFARWAYKNTNARNDISPRNPRFPIYRVCLQTKFRARVSNFKSGISGSEWHDDALIFVSDWSVCILVKYLQDGFTKMQTHAMSRGPVWRLTGEQKLRDFRTPYLRRPIEYMSLHRSGQMWRLSLNHLQSLENDFKTIATFGQNGVVTSTQLVSLSRGFWNRAIIRRNLWAPMTRRCVAFSDWCVCIEVKYLQDGFTPIQTHAMTWRCVAYFRIGAFVSW
jgi:hypothetical protein